MHSFTGEFSRAKKVSLAGRSAKAESREQVLERTRQERERRRQLKVETQAAVLIQVRRGTSARRAPSPTASAETLLPS